MASSAAPQVDRLSKALEGSVPEGALRGIAETFRISIDKLDAGALRVATVLAQLAPVDIPEEFMDGLTEEDMPSIRTALRSRHFVTGGGVGSFGAMHPLMGDVLRDLGGERGHDSLKVACGMVLGVMTPEDCRLPTRWPLMNRCRPHAEKLFARGGGRDDLATSAGHLGLCVGILADAKGITQGPGGSGNGWWRRNRAYWGGAPEDVDVDEQSGHDASSPRCK